MRFIQALFTVPTNTLFHEGKIAKMASKAKYIPPLCENLLVHEMKPFRNLDFSTVSSSGSEKGIKLDNLNIT